MAAITFILLMLNIGVLIALDIGFWIAGWQAGLAGVAGVIAFFAGYALSGELTLAPREFWWNSEFGIFIKKLGFAWRAAGMVFILFYLIFGMTFGFG